ncbi:hypothetical protein PVAP13_5KG295100 [Panicum virgatum]|uniref:Serine aminopeptidase S33 domain-containing protein n=1 Tax=Panicum virgatum TaxID=38727 RepID=A0A8T0SKB6_PANVG|nr:hypothetical protein PVAP13_5KG295100 [Panicum virgatum]
MAHPLVSSKDAHNPPTPVLRVVVANKHGENLVGMLHHAGSNKDDSIMIDLATALTKQGIGAFHFDFSGNGWKCGGSICLYLRRCSQFPMVVNLSGRFYLEKGVEERLGKEFMDRINKEGYIDVVNKSGIVLYKVTKESLMERLNTDMHAACLSISKECRFFTIHGSADKIIPVEDAYEFARLIPNHKLHVIKRANHGYTSHRKQLCDAIINCITSEAGNAPPQSRAEQSNPRTTSFQISPSCLSYL